MIAQTLRPSPVHFLWLNYHPSNIKTDMVYSNEDAIYWALYGQLENVADTENMMIGRQTQCKK